MPRPLVIGNGNLLVALDGDLAIRDLTWPCVGLHNHLHGNRARIGVWVDGRFSWLHDGGWHKHLGYVEGTLVTDCVAHNAGMELTLRLSDCVLHDDDVLVRRVSLHNPTDREREVRLFLAHDFSLAETDIADCVFYNPYLDAVIHYKRHTYLAISARCGDAGLCEYACGIKGFGGAEGTWRDAEDGRLSMNAVAQGSVDSVVSVCATIPPRESAVVDACLCAAADLAGIQRLHARVEAEGVERLVERTGRHWAGWTSREAERVSRLPEPIPAVFRRSLLTIRTNADNRGAILAANDSDIMETARAHYSYMWPRDGALVAMALDRLGERELSERFLLFCRDVLPKDRAAFLHKYGADGSWGSTWHPWVVDGQPEMPFQEDSTALTVIAAWRHYQATDRGMNSPATGPQAPPELTTSASRDLLELMYADVIRPCADFMAGFRDPATGLPLPSYDLWEERRGVHAYTCGTVYGALVAAAEAAEELGDAPSESRYRAAAEELRTGILRHLWDEDYGRFARSLVPAGDELRKDMTMDSAVCALFAFGALAPDDPRMAATMRAVVSRLWVRTEVGGIARYENDYYFRRSEDIEQVPGNPWFICTLWAAQWYIAHARSREELETPLGLLMWAATHALPTGILPEQLHPYTGEPLSVAPLTWSHAEFIATTLDYLDAEERLEPRMNTDEHG